MQHFKPSQLILAILTTVMLSNCVENKAQKPDRLALLETIANDSVYIKYKIISDEGMLSIARKEVDLQAMIKLYEQKQWDSDAFCSAPDEVLAQVKGGVLLRNQTCKEKELMDALFAKYPEYEHISDEEREILTSIYKANSNYDSTIRIMEALKNRKNQKQ